MDRFTVDNWIPPGLSIWAGIVGVKEKAAINAIVTPFNEESAPGAKRPELIMHWLVFEFG